MSTLTDIEILDETILDDAPGCQFTHVRSECANEVTHFGRGCQTAIMLCPVAAETVERRASDPYRYCSGCHQPASGCWKVIPI